MGEQVSECTAGTKEKLEEIMKRCTPEQKVVVERTGELDYVVVRRRGVIAALALNPGTAPEAEGLYRKEIADVVAMAGRDNIIESVERPANNVACIATFPYSRGNTYDIPEGATFMRRANKKVKFFSGAPSPSKNNTRRKFIPIPEDAVQVKYNQDRYEWVQREKS